MYSPQLLQHFEHPRNVGEVEKPDAVAQLENPACGDVLRISLRLSEDKVSEIRFRAKGCVPSMACASAITELVKGRSIHELSSLKPEDLALAVGGLPEASSHAAQLAMDVLKELHKQLRDRPSRSFTS